MEIPFRSWFGSVSFPDNFCFVTFDMVAEQDVQVIRTASGWSVWSSGSSNQKRRSHHYQEKRRDHHHQGKERGDSDQIIISMKEKSICFIMIIDSILACLIRKTDHLQRDLVRPHGKHPEENRQLGHKEADRTKTQSELNLKNSNFQEKFKML